MRFNTMVFFALLLIVSVSAVAQDKTPAPVPVKAFTGNFGAGLAITGGNTDTKNFNLSFEAKYDPKTKNTVTVDGLYLRSNSNKQTIADRFRLNLRDDFLLSKRISLYGEIGYLRDPFKNITYLLNPQSGIGFKACTSDRVELTLSGGAGGVWEKNPGSAVHSSGALNADESFSFKISDTAKLTQNVTGLWKTQDMADAFYHFDIGLVTSIVKKIEVKVEFADDFKNKTPSPEIKKNDTALITSFLYKF